MKRVWVIRCLTAALGLLFLVPGLLKLADPAEFARAIARYHLVDGPLVAVAAYWIPWMEILGAAGLWLARWRRSGAWFLLGLVVVFELALGSAFIRGLDIDCGCWGTNASGSVSFAFMRNLFLLAAVAIFLKLESDRK